jgi:hypothetical protein
VSDYNVVYVVAGPDDSRRSTTERLQHECTNAGKEGWRLTAAVPDLHDGATHGLWLFFESGDVAEGDEVKAAEAILEETMPPESARG